MHTSFRPFRTVFSLGSVLLLIVACAGEATGSRWTYAPLPTGTPTPTGSPGTSPGGSPGASPGVSPGASPGVSPGASPSGSPGTSPGGSPGTSPSGPPSGSLPAEVIELTETATLQITQDGQPVTSLTVRQGQTYTFRITNEAGFTHNFHIGPADRLAADDVADLPGVPDFASGTQEFQYQVTEETASLEFACTVPGHYGPMHGTFTVEP